MPKAKKQKIKCDVTMYKYKFLVAGIVLILAGLMLDYGYSISSVFYLFGILAVLKWILCCFK